MSKEIWKPVNKHNFGNTYEVSNFGNIRNINTKHVLKPTICNGYCRVHLGNPRKEKPKVYFVHTLVIESFIRSKYKKEVVNHIDGCKTNNILSNLEFASRRYNTEHAHDLGLIKKVGVPIIVEDVNGDIFEYQFIKELIEATGITHRRIIRAINNNNSVDGLKIKYKDDNYKKSHINLSKFTSINGFKNYLINEQGEVYSKTTKRILKISFDKTYPEIKFSINNKTKHKLLHVLLAETYIPNPKNLPQVNHIDHNKFNYSLDNLEWVTRSENSNKYYEHKRNQEQESNADEDLDEDLENKESKNKRNKYVELPFKNRSRLKL